MSQQHCITSLKYDPSFSLRPTKMAHNLSFFLNHPRMSSCSARAVCETQIQAVVAYWEDFICLGILFALCNCWMKSLTVLSMGWVYSVHGFNNTTSPLNPVILLFGKATLHICVEWVNLREAKVELKQILASCNAPFQIELGNSTQPYHWVPSHTEGWIDGISTSAEWSENLKGW